MATGGQIQAVSPIILLLVYIYKAFLGMIMKHVDKVSILKKEFSVACFSFRQEWSIKLLLYLFWNILFVAVGANQR